MNTELWYEQSWVQTALQSTAIAAVGFIQIWYIWRQLSAVRKKNAFDVFNAVAERMSKRFGATSSEEFYSLSESRFSGLKNFAQRDSDYLFPSPLLLERIRAIRELPTDVWAKDFKKIQPICNALSDIAALIEFGVVSSKQFLSTYHLIVLREGWIMEPFIYDYSLFRNPGRWGMRVLQLLECARQYHEENRLHSHMPVYILDAKTNKPRLSLPAVWQTPHRPTLTRITRNLAWRTGLIPKVSQRKKYRQMLLLGEVKSEFEHRERTGWQ